MNSEFERHTLSKLVHIDQKSLGKKTPEDFTFSYISLSDVSSGNISKTLEKHSFKSAPSRARRVLQNGDIIMATVRPNLQGFAKITEEFSHCVASTGFAVLSPKDNVSGEFIYQCLYSYQITKQIESLVVGSNYPAINSSDVAGLHIYTPPYPEQRKIAKILSTWDKAISTTECLIDNSKQQKKALMQQLLTGKKRLLDDSGMPFEGEWEEVRLGELIEEFVNGYAFTASNYKNHGIPIITMGNISLDGNFDERQLKQNFWEDDDALDKYKIKLGDLLIAMTDVTPDKNLIGRMTIVDVDKTFYLNQRVGLLKLSNKIDSIFLKYLSNESSWRKYSIAVSASGVQANMGTKDIKKGVIHLPHLDEQQKIASVLSNADKEIELLEQQLADLKQEKKALMQQLLTGKRRVKVDDKEVA